MCTLSRACFVYKRIEKNGATSPKKEASSDNADVFSRSNRLSLFNKVWSTVQQEVEDLHSLTHSRVLGDLLDFVENASKEMGQWRTSQIIPTATLIAGVNMPDHNAVFTTLRKDIVRRVTPHVALLTSKDATNIKILIKALVASILSVQDETEDEECVETSAVKRNQLTMSVLASWYSHVVANSNNSSAEDNSLSPSKRPKTSQEHPAAAGSSQSPHGQQSAAVVIVLRDLEAFPSDVLQRFVVILSDYFDRVPFILVFGLSTSAFTVHDILTRLTSTKLAIETFMAQNPALYLDIILKKILIGSKFHFKLSSKVFRLFEDVFLFNDLSVRTFISNYKFCMMDYYFENPLSVLCDDLDSIDKRISEMDTESIECVRRLKSFRPYVEDQPPKERRALLLDDERLKVVLLRLLQDIRRYHYDFFPVLYCLHAIVSDLPKFPLGKLLRETYSACLNSDIVYTQDFEDSMNLLNLMAKDELVDRLTRGCESLQSCNLPSVNVSKIRRSLKSVLHRINVGLSADDVAGENTMTTGTEVQETHTALPKRMNRFELQQRLKSEMATQNKKQRISVTVYSSLREEAVGILREAAKKFLKTPKRLPLHEIFYYDSATSVQSQLIGGSRAAIQMALANPHSYFKCDCCALKEDGSILPTFPDVCIAYKLHLECGRLINLYDWLQAFIMVTEQVDSRKNSSKNKKPTDQLMARFIRSVAELQFLGFVKETNRKTDHVARLTW